MNKVRFSGEEDIGRLLLQRKRRDAERGWQRLRAHMEAAKIGGGGDKDEFSASVEKNI